MSENLNRGIRDFSKYDTMATEELETILRLDAEAPEDAESDVEELFYIMGVLADRRKTANVTGNDAHSAWKSFQENYMPEIVEEPDISDKCTRIAMPWVRRLVAAAAVLALVILVPISARALTFGDLWDIFARWAKETFSFVSGEDTELSEPTPDHKDEFTSLQELLTFHEVDTGIIPTWIPDGFTLEKIEQDITPLQEIYWAFYLNSESELTIRVQTYLSDITQHIEIEESNPNIYIVGGIEYYIIQNIDQLQVIWINDIYECVISGDISIDEAKMMIDSIGKG